MPHPPDPLPEKRDRMLRPHGGYERLRSFRASEIIYDATVAFCDRFIDKRSRTHDQMVQAARSGRQNIAEGSLAAATSAEGELKLVNAARASLGELLLDFRDFLRQRNLSAWGKDDPPAKKVRALGRGGEATAATYAEWLGHRDPAIVANTLVCLIHQASYLLDQQLIALEKQFLEEGGYREQLFAARVKVRNRTDRSDPTDQSDPPPACPRCGKPMHLRTARKGPNAGSQFWGCTAYPACRGTRAKSTE